ncbi:MAG: amino acid ABC transporter permease, partial [Alicyclobacillus sp.]|nr:amino acid ABC transporter permease [Alicyclobacillus sp.]
ARPNPPCPTCSGSEGDAMSIPFHLSSFAEYFPALLAGFWITIELTLIVISISLVLGVLVALARLSRFRWLRMLTTAYVEVIRSTPLLLQLVYIFYVLPFIGMRLNAYAAAIAGLSLNYTAYLSEVYRGGIQAIPKGQWEAAWALGMRPATVLGRVILPQAIRSVIPSLGNYFISLFKDTSLASALTVQELMFSGQLIAARNFDYFTVYTEIFILYFVCGYPATLLVRFLERQGQRQRKGRIPSTAGASLQQGSVGG